MDLLLSVSLTLCLSFSLSALAGWPAHNQLEQPYDQLITS